MSRQSGWMLAMSLIVCSGTALAGTDLASLRCPTGEMVSSVGQSVELDKLCGEKGTVFVFVSTECPLSNGYIPTINRLTRDYAERGVEFVGVNPNAGQTLKEIELHRIRYAVTMPVLKDPGARLAEALGITHCPEVIVFGPDEKAVYRGRIDDRYPRRGGAPKAVIHEKDLEKVLEQLASGERVATKETEVVGCPVVVTATPISKTTESATFSRDIAVVLQKHCQECHRPGGIGPFSLVDYDDVVLWADDVAAFTQSRAMPPWKLVPGHGEFHGERRMSDAEIDLIGRWVKAGCPKGDPAENPEPAKFIDGWRFGTPDIILHPAESYTLGAEGPDEYRHFVIPTNLTEDTYISAMDVLAGNLRVVHHVIVFLDPKGVGEKLDAADPTPGYTTAGGWPGFIAPGALGGWAPGIVPTPLPEGTARIVPKGSRIVLQVHYHKSGKEETDLTKIGLYVSKEKPRRLVRDVAVTPLSALPMLQSLPLVSSKIPAGAKDYTVRETMVVPEDIELLSVQPHMHLIGKEMKVTARLPDGTTKPVLYITNWDFNWQENYYYKAPVALPKDTRLDLVAVFDNSDANPANPNAPPEDVGWGEETTDEMAFAFFEVLPTRDARSDRDLTLAAVSGFMKNWVEYQIRGPHTPLGKFLSERKGK